MRPFICLFVTGVLLAGQLAGCTSWRVQNTPPQSSVWDATKPIRIVRLSGAALTLRGTRVSGDTLYGTDQRRHLSMADTLVAIPLSDIRTIAVRHVSTAKTVGLVAGIIVGVAGVVVLWFVETCALCSN